MTSDFYVTLPSNVPNAPFPNTSSRYVTRLPEVLNLKRGDWVVALTDLVYPHSFDNVGRPLHYWIHFKSDRPPIRIAFPPDQYKDLKQIINTLKKQKDTRLKRSAVDGIIREGLSKAKREISKEGQASLLNIVNAASKKLPEEGSKIPGGSLKIPEGSLKIPEGSLKIPGGSLKIPEKGSKSKEEGSKSKEEGSKSKVATVKQQKPPQKVIVTPPKQSEKNVALLNLVNASMEKNTNGVIPAGEKVVGVPKVEVSKAGDPKIEESKVGTPKVEVPKAKSPKPEVPKVVVPPPKQNPEQASILQLVNKSMEEKLKDSKKAEVVTTTPSKVPDIVVVVEMEKKHKVVEGKNMNILDLVNKKAELVNTLKEYREIALSVLDRPKNSVTYRELLKEFERLRSIVSVEQSKNDSVKYLDFKGVYDKLEVSFVDPDILFVEFDKACAYFLGFTDTIIRSTMLAPHKVDFFGDVSVIYLYSDLVDPIIVGNKKSNLLSVIPCTSQYGSVVYYTVPTPRYVPLINSNIDSIRIELLTDAGEPVPFSWGTTISVLHFKKLK